MDYRRRTTVLSVMFVLVGMMFLVPAMTEKALATIDATAISHVGSFSNVRGHMDNGKFQIGYPQTFGDHIYWKTRGSGIFGGGDERGYVTAKVGTFGTPVKFSFFNPALGRDRPPNTCFVEPGHTPYYETKCTITQGVHATATYEVRPLASLPDAHGGDANSDNEGDNSGDTP
jgi:hypothetical protein